MLMPKKNRYIIYEYLFKEGVLVAKKDFHAPKHPELDVPNLQVIKTLQVTVFFDLTRINFVNKVTTYLKSINKYTFNTKIRR
jgi:Ribosomal protein S10E